MSKKRTIDSFYKRIEDVVDDSEIQTQTQTEPQTPKQAQPQTETQTIGLFRFLIRDPGVRPLISSYPSNFQDEIRRTYITLGPYRLIKSHYPLSPCGRQKRSFQATWFKRFWWLEYSDKTDSAFCFPCYLFGRKPIGRVGSDTFIVKGFNRWRKVNSGKECPFVNHEGMTPSSAHNFSVRCYEDLKNKLCHIENVIDKQTKQEIMDNRLRLQVTIDSTKWLTLQTCPLRGGDDRPTSLNRGNLLELVDLIASYNKKMCKADNMVRWYGLKALILNECPFAYYVHCFAHQLQLALVAASKDVSEVHTFFKHLNFIVNVIGSSTKRNDQLQDAQIDEISHLAEIGELEGGRGSNQMQNLQRAGDTRWSSHFKSICSLLRLFGPTRVVLNDIYLGRATVSTTKSLIQELRDDGWESLLDKVVCFCKKYNILVPDMNVTYRDIIQSRHKKDNVTVEHHYRVDVFIVAIDSQLQELNNRFSESVSELLRLSATLDPRKSFNSYDICKLVTNYYPLDFTDQDKIELKLELQHYELDNDPKLKNVTSLSQLCKGLQETEKSETYPLIDRLIRLILTLPVSTATSERAFSKMKLVKTRLRSTMSDGFLKSSMILSVEREIVRTLCTNNVIDDFYSKTQRRVQMKKRKVSS
ncbi:zinc finger MYM-type protein 1-like protein [Tanacetum coccineum]